MSREHHSQPQRSRPSADPPAFGEHSVIEPNQPDRPRGVVSDGGPNYKDQVSDQNHRPRDEQLASIYPSPIIFAQPVNVETNPTMDEDDDHRDIEQQQQQQQGPRLPTPSHDPSWLTKVTESTQKSTKTHDTPPNSNIDNESKKRRNILIISIIVGLIVVGAVVGGVAASSLGGSNDPEPIPITTPTTPTVPPTTTPPTTPEPTTEPPTMTRPQLVENFINSIKLSEGTIEYPPPSAFRYVSRLTRTP